MILRLALLALSPDDNLGGDFGDDPTTPDSLTLGSAFEPRLLVAVLVCAVLLFVVAVAAHYAGKMVARRRLVQGRVEIAEAMYDEIDRALNRALRAPGASQMDRVRELRDLLQARFGHVIALTNRPEKTRKALAEALDADGGKIKTHDSSPAKVKIAKASEEHRVLVWSQLQAFREFWDRKAEIIGMIVAAQGELVVEHPRWRLDKLEREASVAGVTKPAVAAERAADKATEKTPEKTPEKTETSKDDPPPPPPPPAPPPPSRSGKKLPAHKRNMLA